MKPTFTLLFLLFFSLTGFSQSIDLSDYNDFLKDHVTKKGAVDFDKVLENIDEINEITRSFSKISPNGSWTKSELKAFWINFYNANIIKLLVENYPIKSINYIIEPFKNETIDFSGGKISLDLIEHKILRKLEDPRVHFALYSTAISGPVLKNEAYDAKTVEMDLGVATSNFINDSSKNIIRMSGAELSQAFEWYKDDFDAIPFINKHSSVGQLKIDTPIKYIEYNWNLMK